ESGQSNKTDRRNKPDDPTAKPAPSAGKAKTPQSQPRQSDEATDAENDLRATANGDKSVNPPKSDASEAVLCGGDVMPEAPSKVDDEHESQAPMVAASTLSQQTQAATPPPAPPALQGQTCAQQAPVDESDKRLQKTGSENAPAPASSARLVARPPEA